MTEYLVRIPISGTRNGEPWPDRGKVIDLPDAEALGYLNAGYIVPVPQAAPSAATVPDPTPESDGKARAPRRSVKAEEKAEADAAAKKAEDAEAAAAATKAAEAAAAAEVAASAQTNPEA